MIKIKKALLVGVTALLGTVSLAACNVPGFIGQNDGSNTTLVSNKAVASVSVKNNKEVYEYGEALDLTVTIRYSDGSTEIATDYSVTGFDAETYGIQSVTVNCEGKVSVLSVAVKPRPVYITKLTVVDNKAEDGYELEEQLDLTVVANYSDGTTQELTDYTVSTFDNHNPGEQVLTISYHDVTSDITVTVNPEPAVLESISVVDNKLETGYDIGEELDIVVLGHYSDGSVSPIEEFEVTGFDSYVTGSETLTVTVGEEFTTTVDVKINAPKVIAIVVKDNNSDIGYELDEELNLQVIAKYNDGSEQEVTEYTTDGYDNQTIGDHEVTVSYLEFTANVTVSVKESSFPEQEFESFVDLKDVWVEIPLPYGTGEWANSLKNDKSYGKYFHAETLDQRNISITEKYTKVLKEANWTVEKNGTSAAIYTNARKGNAIIKFRSYRTVFSFDVYATDAPRPVYPESISITGPEAITQTRKKKLKVNFAPANTNQTEVEWSSADESIATVNEKGAVKGINLGKTLITAKAKNAAGQEITASYEVNITEKTGDAWTIMLYVCGSNLESMYGAATDDINEILKVSNQPDDVNIIIETGGSSYWYNSQIKSNKLGRFHVANKKIVEDAQLNYSNMGKEETFESFVKWGLSEYPAENTGVILWNHGGALEGCCYDDIGGSDVLTNSEVGAVMDRVFDDNNRTSKLEFIGYDACLMQVQDIAEYNSHFFNYMVGSEEVENGDGWDYTSWVDDLYAGEDTETILNACADGFLKQYGASADQTLSVLDLNKMENYFDKWETMSAAIKSTARSNISSFKSILKSAHCYEDVSRFGSIDAYDFLTKLKEDSKYAQYSVVIEEAKTAFNQLVIHNCAGTKAGKSYGLALHAEVGGQTYPASETSFDTWRSIFA